MSSLVRDGSETWTCPGGRWLLSFVAAALMCVAGVLVLGSSADAAKVKKPKLTVAYGVSGKTVKVSASLKQPGVRKKAQLASRAVLVEKVLAKRGKKTRWVVRAKGKVPRKRGRSNKFRLKWKGPAGKKHAKVRVRVFKGKRRVAQSPVRKLRFEAPGSTKPINPNNELKPTATSDGGAVKVGLDGVVVEAPAGAIAAGETLSVTEQEGTGDFPEPDAPAATDGFFKVSTSQGQPSSAVKITLSYDPAQLAEGEQPLIVHGYEETQTWVPEETSTGSEPNTVSAQVDHFSLFSVIGNFTLALGQKVTWLAGNLTGNRGSKATGCHANPSSIDWIDDVYITNNPNDAIPACIGSESTGDRLYLHVSNNRGYMENILVANATVNVDQSHWSDSLEGYINKGLGTLSSSQRLIALSPGSSAVLAIDRTYLPYDTPVLLQSVPESTSATSMVAWSLLQQTLNIYKGLKLGAPLGIINCAAGVINQTFTGDIGTAALSRLKTCVDAATGLSGVAKAALAKVSVAILATNILFKFVDVIADEASPPRISFTIKAAPDDPEDPWEPTDPEDGDYLVAKSVSTGEVHSCAVRVSGQVVCWGYGADGRLGNGSSISSSVPVEVLGLADAKSVSAGDSHSCAVRVSGQVVCWGYGADGQLGNGSDLGSSVPVDVSGLTDAKSVSAGFSHSCAVRGSGQVVCWGYGGFGRLGNGSYDSSSVPVEVSGLTDATSISAGFTPCAVRVSGQVVCWGYGADGQLGNGSSSSSSVPVEVSGLADAKSVFAGFTPCAVRVSGQVLCWGNNYYGQLGDGTNTDSSTPVAVQGLSDAKALSTNDLHSCAVKASGQTVCWGYGGSGRLGNGSSISSSAPVNVSGLADAKSVSAGGGRSCAVRLSGQIVCWGDGFDGSLGNGLDYDHDGFQFSAVPVPVLHGE